MLYESLTPELRAWLRENIARGSTREALELAMAGAGYQPGYARDAVELGFRQGGVDDDGSALPPVVDRASAPGTVTASGAVDSEPTAATPQLPPNTIVTADRAVHVLCSLRSPRVILFGDLLSAAECDELIALSRGKLERSSVVNVDTGAYEEHPHRTSWGTHFVRGENALIQRIEARIAEMLQFPVEHGEPIQILHYTDGAEYRPHYDYFDPAQPGNDKVLATGGQRIATLVMYLNDVEAGGSTVFPQLGLDVAPRRGNAIYFAYAGSNGWLDERTLHGGSPVTAGEKWIATKWLRERPY